MTFDLSRLASYDSETPKFRAGYAAPHIVCASSACMVDGAIHGELLPSATLALERFEQLLDNNYVIAFAYAAYDLAVAAQANARLLGKIFKALREGRIHDILLAQGLNDIFYGHLGANSDGSDLRKPLTGETTNRYSLDIVHKILTGKIDAKQNDDYRESYALLQNIPVERWPPEAVQYPKDDANNTFEDAAIQIVGRRDHAWAEVPGIPGVARSATMCTNCGEVLGLVQPSVQCPRAEPVPHKNLDNLIAQVEADFALKINAAHSLRTDPERVEKLSVEVETKHKKAVERFQKKGWIRENETEDQGAVKRAIALAYGAKGICKKCCGGVSCRKCEGSGNDGTGRCKDCGGLGKLIGKLTKIDIVDCRGVKVKGRYQGCILDSTCPCGGSGKVPKIGNDVTCKNVFDEAGVMVEEGCDGTGLDLSTAPLLPRTKKIGVCTDRDAAMESGDEDLSDYGENEFEKSRSTFIPYLRTGIVGPLWISPNCLVSSGRCSYEGCPVHQFPRDGGERECIRARGAWCGYPIETVLGSTDYSAGELCTLSQYTYWLFGYSRMRDAINASGNPGILHSELAAEVLGLSLEEFLIRLEAKDKQATLFRQSSKPMNFGKPACMGSAKIVLTNRKKNTGFTVCEGGPARNKKGEPGYWGIRFCITIGGAKACGVEKIMEWKRNPTPPVCKACVEAVENILTPAYFRRFPEIKDYHEWGKKMIREKRPVPSVVWDRDAGQPKIVRERGFINWEMELSALLNNGFQSMLADIGKDAYVTATRECFLGVTDDGSPSPLAGCRLPLFMHDEPVSELILATSHLSGPRIAKIMVESGNKFAPDVTWKADTALAFHLSKAMEPVYDLTGKLIPWEPKQEKKAA
jgi:hypothetical protein